MFNRIQERIEKHKGRKLDLTNRRDLFMLKSAINREFSRQSQIITNVQNVLKGEQTYDQSKYKTIIDSSKK